MEYWAEEIKERVTDCVWMFIISTKNDLVAEDDFRPIKKKIVKFVNVSLNLILKPEFYFI